MAETVAIFNQKGGSTKTTTSVSLAAALVERGARVLLLDLDSQGSASGWLGIECNGRDLLETLLDRKDLTPTIYQTPYNFDFIPNGHYFAGFEKAAPGTVGFERLLRDTLALLPADTWDYILLDCPPSISAVTINALTAARWTLVPVLLESLSMKPLRTLIQAVESVKAAYNPELSICGLVACRVDLRESQSREILAFLSQREDFFKTIIRRNVRLSEAPNAKVPITRYAPDSPGAEDYRALAEEFEARIGSRVVSKPAEVIG